MQPFRGAGQEEGQATLALLLVAACLVVAGAALLQLAMAADRFAGAQDAADAAALAAAIEVRNSLTTDLGTGDDLSSSASMSAEREAAADFAARNGASLVEYHRTGLTVRLSVEAIGDPGPIDWFGLEASPSVASAAASITPVYQIQLPRSPGGTISRQAIVALEGDAGVRVRPDSALFAYGSDCRTGIDVAHLSDAMKTAIVRLEHAMGRPLRLTSGFRDHACQAALFTRISGPVAPPGRSLHNYGHAIDVAEPDVVAAHARSAGLCQPLPVSDRVHFSLASSSECGGIAGVLLPGGAYGGDPSSFVKYEVRLVDSAKEVSP